MFDFQNLQIYQLAKLFHLDLANLIRELQLHRSVSDQLYRASFSIPLNIAEASGRFSNPDRRNFYVIARSSVFECVAILDLIHDQQLISDSQFIDYLEKSENLSKIIFALIKKYS